LEKDCAHGVFYLPELKQASAGERDRSIAAARRRLLARALERGRSFEPYMRGIPSPRISLARGAALLMALFTLGFWQRTGERLGVTLSSARDRIDRVRSFALVVRAVFSRAGYDAVLARLDRIFEEAGRRLALAPDTRESMTQGTATSPASTPALQSGESRSSRFRDLLFRLRGWGVIALGAVVLAWQWPLKPRVELVLAALPLVLFGIFFRVWARCYFTRGSDTRRIQAHRLVLLGPYRRVRNPLYVGNMAVAVGLALAYAGPWAALAFLVALFVLYSGVIRSEEEILAKSHGDAYAEFRRVVPRWIPRLRPLPADPDAPPPALRHALKKEAERMAGALAAWGLALGLALMVR